MKLRMVLILMGLLGAACSCSTVPKGGPPEVRLTRQTAEAQLELANLEADRGNYPGALEILREARRLAVSADYSPMLTRVELSRGTILFFQGDRAGAEAAWQAALEEANYAKDTELAALCRIYMARGRLFAAIQGADEPGKDRTQVAAEVRSQVNTALGLLKQDKASTALGWTVIGLAEKELGRWNDAEGALKKALAIHTEEGYPEQAGYDWYLIASVRSVAGRTTDAITALQEAIACDRRAENTYGLGKDWLALGDVFVKAGKKQDAAFAFRRAAEILRSMDREAEAAAAEQRVPKDAEE